jgi:hypothetical protein
LVKFLIASRVDRFGPQVSRERINKVLAKHGSRAFFEVSAKRGDGVEELTRAIRDAIPWKDLPKISAPAVFWSVKDFIIDEKSKGVPVEDIEELLQLYLKRENSIVLLEEEFENCLRRLETVGLVKLLSIGRKVLLDPELVDDYMAWICMAARSEPDGLGFIPQERVIRGDFTMDFDRPLADHPDIEKMILVETLKEVLARGIAIKEHTAYGPMIVFPSELRADIPEYPGGYDLDVIFQFEGPVKAIHAGLAVRLIYSKLFEKKNLYRDAVILSCHDCLECGFKVEHPDPSNDTLGKMIVFFDKNVPREVKLSFLRFVSQQIRNML